jgi:TRAP-type uncharacterized transport system fused permease subunit
MSQDLKNRRLIEHNAVALGYHIGLVFFVIAVASKESTETLSKETSQVLQIGRSRINEYIKFFNLDVEFNYPTSPNEARVLFANLPDLRSKAGSDIDDALSVGYGNDAAELYALGRRLPVYPLVLQHVQDNEEAREKARQLEGAIRGVATRLKISDVIDEILSQPERLQNPDIIDRIIAAREKSWDYDGTAIRRASPWVTGLFYLASLVVLATVFLIVSRTVDVLALPIVLIAALLGVSIVGAFQLRHDDRLAERSFLDLMGLTLRSLPLLRRSDPKSIKAKSSARE